MEVEPKLSIEMIPRSAWNVNVQAVVSRKQWDEIRYQVYRRAGRACEVCKKPSGDLQAHEVWEWNEETRVQRLVKIVALCTRCHEVKHFGLAQMRGRDHLALKQLMKINGWDENKASQYVEEQAQLWERRSMIEWSLQLQELRSYGVEPPRRVDNGRST